MGIRKTSKNKLFSFIHTADLHLDSPFIGIYEINQELRESLVNATFEAYDTIIDLCIEKEVDFLLIAGDVYDSANKSLYAQLKFIKGLDRLSNAGIQTIIAHGNHDPLNGWSATLNWPEDVHIMSGENIDSIQLEKDEKHVVTIVGTSYPEQNIWTNLAQKFPKRENNEVFTIGLLHCMVGSSTEHDPYAACTMQDLKDLDYDYWALGHIHVPSAINEIDPVVVYSGNPQGRHIKEAGPRGCYLVKVDTKNEISKEFIETDTIRWYVEDISIAGIESEEDLILQIRECIDTILDGADGRSVICRFILTGRGPLHRTLTKEGIIDDILQYLREDENLGSQFVWVERLVNNTSMPIERSILLERKDFVGDIVRIVDEICQDEESLESLKTSLGPLFKSAKGRKVIKDIDEEELMGLVHRAEGLLLDNIMSEVEYEN
ncbi:MAG: DNA repair exonuclease [ANME-2 cluster archaeon]|nr:DNA repair exonuclease [ANME-2 cluster archaeon]